MHIRSSLVLLSKIAQSFPTRKKAGNAILELVNMLEKEETDRSDLSLMARSLSTILKKRAPAWIDDEGKKQPPESSAPPSEGLAPAPASVPPAASSAASGESR
jgi:hypothetical protein